MKKYLTHEFARLSVVATSARSESVAKTFRPGHPSRDANKGLGFRVLRYRVEGLGLCRSAKRHEAVEELVLVSTLAASSAALWQSGALCPKGLGV